VNPFSEIHLKEKKYILNAFPSLNCVSLVTISIKIKIDNNIQRATSPAFLNLIGLSKF
jgi:hypothetical protein